MKIPESVGSKYRFIVLAGRRVAQLQKGARPRLDNNADHTKMTAIAIRELEQSKLTFVEAEVKPDIAIDKPSEMARKKKPEEVELPEV